MAVTLAIPTTTSADARSSHVADSNIQPFLHDDFDPADYLNNALPPLSTSSNARPTPSHVPNRPVPLNELSTQLQTLLAQLNAQTSRLSNALTTLTDEILRSGGRLAYEVEVLRGETTTLTDSLDNGLKDDIELFTGPPREVQENAEADTEEQQPGQEQGTLEPQYLTRLKTLTAVRANLDAVIKLFGEAMAWPLAPSDLSLASSLISVSAPETTDDTRSREEKGKAYIEKARNEISELTGSGKDPVALEAAAARVEELRVLAEVWKGTAEEKARAKIVEGLARPVEERQRALGQGPGGKRTVAAAPVRGVDYRYGNLESSRGGTDGGYGFLQNLRNLKNDMYLE